MVGSQYIGMAFWALSKGNDLGQAYKVWEASQTPENGAAVATEFAELAAGLAVVGNRGQTTFYFMLKKYSPIC